MLCPFNTQQNDEDDRQDMLDFCYSELEDKDIMIRFGPRVREIDRRFEKFNNQDFDNGVYHKFAYQKQP